MKERAFLIIMVCMAIMQVGLVSCSDDAHEGEYPLPDGFGGLVVGLKAEAGVQATDVHLFVFDAAQRLAHHGYFDDPRKAALHISCLPAGLYTAVAVLNVGEDFMPPSTRTTLPAITLPEFRLWIEEVVGQYPDMLTGMGSEKVEPDEVARLIIVLRGGASGIRLPVLRLLLSLPGADLPEYVKPKTRAQEDIYIIRCVAELCMAGTDDVVLHRVLTPVRQADGTWLVELEASPDVYDLRLWTDYARTGAPLDDTCYGTENLQTVSLATNPYTANTDAKDAAYDAETGLNLPVEGTTLTVPLQRPLAKYRLVANDAEAYRKLSEEFPERYPPLEELTATVDYEGFFPSVFNVAEGRPTQSIQGLSFSKALSTVSPDAEEVEIASDWMLTNGGETFVKASVTLSDQAGNVIVRTTGVEIPHKRNHQTILRGNFLTAGIGSGGIGIDTEWEDTYVVEF